MVDAGDDGGDAGSVGSWRWCEEFEMSDWLSLLDLSIRSEMLSELDAVAFLQMFRSVQCKCSEEEESHVTEEEQRQPQPQPSLSLKLRNMQSRRENA